MENKKEKNRGTGAGGANTNTNGKKYEKETLLSENYKVIKEREIKSNKKKYEEIKFNGSDIKYIHLEQSTFNMYMNEIGEKNSNITSAPGCKNPDDCYIDEVNKKIFIIEKKFQQTGGSVEEKIQTASFKKNHYKNLYPNYEIHYIYCLSKWFKNEDNSSVIEYLKENDIPVFFNDDKDYDKLIVKYIIKKSKGKNQKEDKEENEVINEKINMKDIFTDELPIRHVINKKEGKKIKIGLYEKNKDKIISNENEYNSLSAFAKSHYMDVESDRQTVNGWVECEIYIDGKWKSADYLRNNKKIKKAVKKCSSSNSSDSESEEDEKPKPKKDKKNKSTVGIN